VLTAAGEVLAGIRGAKSTAQVSMKTEVSKVEVSGPADRLELAASAEGDLRAAGRIIGEIVWRPDESDTIAVVATL
jgi:valyl-tRNA synthetase